MKTEKDITDMKQQIARLAQLQQVEMQVARTRTALVDVPRRRSALEDQIAAGRHTSEATQDRLSELKQTYRQDERQSQDTIGRVAHSREKLRVVKTNKEYRSSLKEINELERMNSKLEDRMIACLEETEEVERKCRRDEAAIAQLEVQVREQVQVLDQENRRLEAELARLEDEQRRYCAKLDPKLMERYRRVKDQLARWPAASPVSRSVCQGCNMNIPPQMFNEMQRCDNIQHCPHCQRLIYWDQCIAATPAPSDPD